MFCDAGLFGLGYLTGICQGWGGIMGTARSAVAVVLLIAVLVGQAQAQQGMSGFGPGLDSCGQFLHAVDSERKARPPNSTSNRLYTRDYIAYESYLEGFLTGANWGNWAATKGFVDTNVGFSINDYFAGEMLWLENYCRAHPLDTYLAAVINLRKTLKEQGR
jgi:hypothetical protein